MLLKPRHNELGIPCIDPNLRSRLFGTQSGIDDFTLQQIKFNLLPFDIKIPLDPVDFPPLQFPIPDLPDIEEIAADLYGSDRQRVIDFIESPLPRCPHPDEIWLHQGWVRYSYEDGTLHTEPCSAPLEEVFVCDVETCVKQGNSPVMASAVSPQAYYLWLHPSLISPLPFKEILIPVGQDRIIINHNVKFDTAHFQETYDLSIKRNRYVDTMSFHIALNGMSHKQRNVFSLYRKGKANYATSWAEKTSPSNLIDAYNFHCKPLRRLTEGDKTLRNLFVTANLDALKLRLLELIEYSLLDSKYTFSLAKALIPKYLKKNPSLVSFGGALALSQSFLPTENYTTHLKEIETTYSKANREINQFLKRIADKWATDFKNGKLTLETINKDPYLSALDWTPAKSGKTKGIPLWYRKLKTLSTKSRVAPLLLGIQWEGNPIVFIEGSGWCFPSTPDHPLSFQVTTPVTPYFKPGTYSRIPHKNGINQNCGDPLGKDYIKFVDEGKITSNNADCKRILELSRSVSYWRSIRKRARYYKPQNGTLPNGDPFQMIEPLLVVHGTTSRRCTESCWLTVSSAKKHVIGSELKGMIRPPKGYVMVGSDFDAQEMKIAASFADAYRLSVVGSTPMGFTQATADKSKGTDSHTLLAKTLALSGKDGRQVAKILNFQMLYLSGIAGCSQSIKNEKPELENAQVIQLAKKAVSLRRGNKEKSGYRTIYKGGTDSDAYNFMIDLSSHYPLSDHLAHLQTESSPRTPMLGAPISEAIESSVCGDDYATSRANWSVQSTGVDLLHTLTPYCQYLIKKLKIDALFMFSYHDEVWFMVSEKDRYRFAYVLQLAHLLTWAYFFKRLGFNDIPWVYQFFSSVNLDRCFRKEVNDSQITPSNSIEVPPGESLTIYELMEKLGNPLTVP